jgi:hypothetical protein
VKQLFPFHEFAADAVDEQMLIDGVKVEEENQAHQPAHSLRQNVNGVEILMKVRAGKQKRGQPDGEQQSNDERRGPEPPFAPLDPAEVGARGPDLCASRFAHSPRLKEWQSSPAGTHFSLPCAGCFSSLPYMHETHHAAFFLPGMISSKVLKLRKIAISQVPMKLKWKQACAIADRKSRFETAFESSGLASVMGRNRPLGDMSKQWIVDAHWRGLHSGKIDFIPNQSMFK